VPHHGLREVSLPAGKERARSQEAPEDDHRKRGQVPHQRRRPRLRNQEESCAAFSGGGRQGQGDDIFPWARDDADGPGTADSGAPDQGRGSAEYGGVPPAAGGEHTARDSGAEEGGTAEESGEREAKACGPERTRPEHGASAGGQARIVEAPERTRPEHGASAGGQARIVEARHAEKKSRFLAALGMTNLF